MLLMIDNYDSFTYNLVQYFKELEQHVVVYRNDEITCDRIEELNPRFLVLSPGPGSPENAGICVEVVNRFAGKIPLLGVCLGHQAIALALGGAIGLAQKPLHGKTNNIRHYNQALFRDLPNDLSVVRYHSIVVSKVPDNFTVSAQAYSDDAVMAMHDTVSCVYGLQFHPESFATESGKAMLENFLALGEGFYAAGNEKHA